MSPEIANTIRKHSKICIIGAGSVGATIAFSLATRKMVSELVIIDVNTAKAEGEAMDISHGLVSMAEMNIYCGTYEDIADSDVIVVAAGLGRKPGETRLDLATKNVSIAKDVAANIMKHYNGGVILVVANPVDVLTYVIQKETGLPTGRVFGTGAVLDSARFRYLLGEKIGVDVKNIHGFIAGEHGDSQFAVWSTTQVGGMNLDSYCKKYGVMLDKAEIEKQIITSGSQVIKLKGATFYAIASLTAELCGVILKDTHSIYSVSTLMQDYYGIKDVCISVPTVVGIQGAVRPIEIDFTDEEMTKLQNSAKTLREFLDHLSI